MREAALAAVGEGGFEVGEGGAGGLVGAEAGGEGEGFESCELQGGGVPFGGGVVGGDIGGKVVGEGGEGDVEGGGLGQGGEGED